MKMIISALALVASMGAIANPAIEAAAMDQGMIQTPDRRDAGGAVLLDEVSIPTVAGSTHDTVADEYPINEGYPTMNEGYPSKNCDGCHAE